MEDSDSDGPTKKRKKKKEKPSRSENLPPEIRVFRLDSDFFAKIDAPAQSMTSRYEAMVEFQESRKKKLSFIPMLHKSCARYTHIHIICVSSAASRTSETVKTFFKKFFKIDSSSPIYKDFLSSGTKYNFNQLHQFDVKYFTPKYFSATLPFFSMEDIAAYESSYFSNKVKPVFDLFRENFHRGTDFVRPRHEEEWCDHEKEKSLRPDLVSENGSQLFTVRALPDAPDEIFLKGKLSINLYFWAATPTGDKLLKKSDHYKTRAL